MKLYAYPASPPCRAVHALIDILKLKAEYIKVHPLNGETKTDEFLELNPQHTIPLLVDGDVVLSESRAILSYLAAKYDQRNKLYPKDVKQRAKVDMRLFFDMGTFFKAIQDAVGPIMFEHEITIPDAKMDRLLEVLKWLSDLVRSGYCAGTDEMTIADLSLLSSYASLKRCDVVDTGKYRFIEAWFNRCKQQVPNYETVVGDGAREYGDYYKAAIKRERRTL